MPFAFSRPHTIRHFYEDAKKTVYAIKPATVAELRAAIESECTQIPRGLFRDVRDSIASRCQQCLDQNGRKVEHIAILRGNALSISQVYRD